MIVAVLGTGKIGEAVARSLAESPKVSSVVVTKRNISTLKSLPKGKVELTSDNRQAARKADLIIITVKAGDAKQLLNEISRFTSKKIVISLMAAITIPRDVAYKLVTKTLTGTANFLSLSKMHPAELRESVTTPAGTTIAGIYELEKGSLRTSIVNTVDAATTAAEKVAKRFEND